MKWRPPRNDQNGGNQENSDPIAPNHGWLGPQKRIQPGHISAPAKQVLVPAVKILLGPGHVAHSGLPSWRGSYPQLIQSHGRIAKNLTGSHFGSHRPRTHESAYLPLCQQFPSCIRQSQSLACRLPFLVAVIVSPVNRIRGEQAST
jgi:hypothetical protein